MTILDQQSDKSLKILSSILHANPEYVSLLRETQKQEKLAKEKEKQEKETHGSAEAFAWPELKKFDVSTPKEALLSKLYASVGKDLPANLMPRIDNALNLHGVKVGEVRIPKETKEKTASEKHYMLPDQKRGNITTPSQLKSAQDFLNQRRDSLDSTTKTIAAVNLVKRAFELKEDLKYPWLYKQAGLTYCHRNKLVDWLEARETACKTAEEKKPYVNLVKMAQKLPFWYYNHKTLVKLAGYIHELDKEAKLTKYYGNKLLDPVHTVFNTIKLASAHTDIQGKIVPNQSLMNIDPQTYGDILGNDVVSEITDTGNSSGNIDLEKLSTIIQTLPKDMQLMLLKELGL